MLGAESLHQLHVRWLVAVGGKDAEMGLTPAEGNSRTLQLAFFLGRVKGKHHNVQNPNMLERQYI